jgi:hypothetical protein
LRNFASLSPSEERPEVPTFFLTTVQRSREYLTVLLSAASAMEGQSVWVGGDVG